MATNLYETLGISRNATSEEVRKAYRRKALETHPDRLPQGASAVEKSTSEDLFRKVNNAYEVLNDPQSRAAYDQHGVWPPPTPTAQGPFANGPHGHNPFSDAFFREPFTRDPFFRGPRMDPFGGFDFGSPSGSRGFTDPFVLFNSIFGDLHRAFEAGPFFDDPFGRPTRSNHFGGGFFGSAFPSMFPPPFNFGDGSMGSSSMQTFGSGNNGGRWISQSWSSSTVDGVTHTKSVRRDSQGNEHVTYRYPDGTERHMINGVEQPTSHSTRALPPSAPPVSYPTRADSMPPPNYYEAVAQPRSRSHSLRHHYYDYPGDRREDRERHRHKYGQGNDRGKEYEIERGGHGHRDDGYRRDGQGGSSWKLWGS